MPGFDVEAPVIVLPALDPDPLPHAERFFAASAVVRPSAVETVAQLRVRQVWKVEGGPGHAMMVGTTA